MNQTLDKIPVNILEEIIEACNKAFQIELNTEGFYGKGQTTWSIPEIGLVYKNTQSNEDLKNFVYEITETENIRQAYAKIYEVWEVKSKGVENTMQGAPEREFESNTLTPDQLKQFGEEARFRSERDKQTRENSKKAVGEAINKKQEIYAKVKLKEQQTLTNDQQESLIELKKSAKDPGFKEQLAEVIKPELKKVNPVWSESKIEEASLVTSQNISQILNGQTSTLATFVANEALINGILTRPKEIAIVNKKFQDFKTSKTISEIVFGDKFTQAIFIEPLSVSVSSVPLEGYTPFDILTVTNPEIVMQAENSYQPTNTTLTNTPRILSEISKTTADEVNQKPTFVDKSKIKLTFDKTIAEFKSSSQIKISNAKNIIKNAINPQKSLGFSKVSSYVNGILSDIGSKLKISLKGMESKQGMIVAGGGLVAFAGIAAGNIPLAATGGTVFTAGVGINPINVFNGSAFSGIIGSIGGLFSAILGAVVTGVVVPIIIATLAVPFIVALFLFIINSGAYVVPPSSNTFANISSPYIDITKVPTPKDSYLNSEIPTTVTYTITVRAKKDTLSNVTISSSCQIISKTQTQCPSINPVSIPQPPSGQINAGQTFSFSYTSLIDQKYTDSSIIDTITVKAGVVDKSGATAEGSAAVTVGNPPISCPLPGGKPDNSMNYSYNSQTNTGHGSTQYWNMMGEPHYRYPLPQLTSCMSPGDCSYYGYAYDVFPHGTTMVYAPTVLGKNIIWNLSGTFTNPDAGYSLEYTSGQYTLVLTHVKSPNAPKTASSGSRLTELFDQGTNTHLHIEFQVNGQWVKPENYFCK